jgi:hypothetical protein
VSQHTPSRLERRIVGSGKPDPLLSTAAHPIILNLTKPSFNRSCEDIASRMKASIAPALLSRAMTDPRHVVRHRVVA